MSIITRKKANRDYAKSVQMGVTFPSPDRRAAVQQLISDKAEIEGVNKGVVASSILENALIPLDGEERDIFMACLPFGKEPVYPQNSGIDNALELAFEYAAMAPTGRYSADPGQYLRLATKRAWVNQSRLHGPISESDPRVNLERDLRILADIVGLSKSEEDPIALLEEKEPLAYPFFYFVSENWEELKNVRTTMSFLTYLCAAMQNREDSAEDRQELLETCAIARKTRIAMRQSIESEALAVEESSMTRIAIAGDSIVVFPGSWTVLNASEAENCPHAGVIEVRNSPNAPHIVFLTTKPVNSLTEEDEANILKRAFLQAPILKSINDAQVELEYNSDGGVANVEDYNNAPRIGLFPIQDSDMFSEKSPAPYGAMVIRPGKEVVTVPNSNKSPTP